MATVGDKYFNSFMTEDEAEKYVISCIPKNTKINTTKWALHNFEDWRKAINHQFPITYGPTDLWQSHSIEQMAFRFCGWDQKIQRWPLHSIYWIAENFQGRKLSWISCLSTKVFSAKIYSHTHTWLVVPSNPWTSSSQTSHSPPIIHESFLPQKFPTIRYFEPTASKFAEAYVYGLSQHT